MILLASANTRILGTSSSYLLLFSFPCPFGPAYSLSTSAAALSLLTLHRHHNLNSYLSLLLTPLHRALSCLLRTHLQVDKSYPSSSQVDRSSPLCLIYGLTLLCSLLTDLRLGCNHSTCPRLYFHYFLFLEHVVSNLSYFTLSGGGSDLSLVGDARAGDPRHLALEFRAAGFALRCEVKRCARNPKA